MCVRWFQIELSIMIVEYIDNLKVNTNKKYFC